MSNELKKDLLDEILLSAVIRSVGIAEKAFGDINKSRVTPLNKEGNVCILAAGIIPVLAEREIEEAEKFD